MTALKREELVKRLKLEQALELHLQYNHFPPVNPTFAKAAKEAIENALLDEDNKLVQLPNGRHLTSSEVIDSLHLSSFVEHRMSENGI